MKEWLEELEEAAWDAEMERDFSPGGRGHRLLEEVEQEINQGKITPMDEVLRPRQKQY